MNKKIALITGTSSGIGLELAKKLLNNDYFVIGVCRKPETIKNGDFMPVQCDLSMPENTIKCFKKIKQELTQLDVLVNNAGAGRFGPHETINPMDIAYMVNLNLNAPMIISSILLPLLRKAKGHIINVSSITAKKPSPQGSAYGATKAGLLHFSASLFEEVRKNGVKVTAVCPDITKSAFFNKLTFGPSDKEGAYLSAEFIAEQILHIINQANQGIITEMVIRPQILSLKKL